MLGKHLASAEHHHPPVEGDLEGESAAALDHVSQDVLFIFAAILSGAGGGGGRLRFIKTLTYMA